jgi:hypothetical protein
MGNKEVGNFLSNHTTTVLSPTGNGLAMKRWRVAKLSNACPPIMERL